MRHPHYTYTSVLSKGRKERIGVEVEVGQGRKEVVVGKGGVLSVHF